MHRKQIKPEHDYPMSTMEEREVLNSEPLSNGSRPPSTVLATNNSSPTHEKKRKFLDEDEDEEPVKLTNRDLLVYYAQNSTMHGVPSIVGSELYRGRHVFWMFVVCVMALFLGTVIYWQMSDYYNYPTVTSVDIRYVGAEDFPVITFCDQNILDHTVISKFLNDSNTAYYLAKLNEITGFYHRFARNVMSKVKIPPKNDSINTSETIPEAIQKFLEILKNPRNQLYCSWGDYFWKNCPCTNFRLTSMGVCASVDVRKLAKSIQDNSTEHEDISGAPSVANAMRGLTFYIDVPSEEVPHRLWHLDGFKLVLHEPEEEPLPLSSGVLVEFGTTVEVEISKNVKEGLPPPFKAFGGSICVDTRSNSFDSPLKRFRHYTKEACETECFINFVVDTCEGCKHFLHPGNETTCEVSHLASCYEKAQRLYYGGSNRTKCQCPLPCVQSTYKAAVTTTKFRATKYFKDIQVQYNRTLNQNVAYIHLYYSDPIVSTMRQVAIYSAEGLLGSIGGQIGLFMGFSLVTVAEMLELIFLLATRGRKLDERVKRHKETQDAVQAAMQANA
ncbi:acid-sensing ion channel 5-like isoform X1 [Biomphalaria glabrata]|uniref:Acid-sensing ion channel 5-like isoform X1 n=1 Tax=Biomphalaria glabrata TaxID=6526 RepID=A0A2C9LV23_BIOGL|nr:acid-sensing ion channel 5-like isoform X1 [Biomphalaria glabrata]XP_055859970.1 acid-sensing ion channel 5-like isoform X1 [Biomphalaria glabrata]KAI8743927.1 acid-sensing ion channel 5-like isoform X1 [Biomphalaria glabrata]